MGKIAVTHSLVRSGAKKQWPGKLLFVLLFSLITLSPSVPIYLNIIGSNNQPSRSPEFTN